MKAAILGVGTELTDGQIVNRNASWISKKLKKLGLLTATHAVVPDDRELILKSLDFCTTHADVIFVTGGLGPTSDDFTRELITQWTGLELEFHEASWKHVQDRLNSRGYVVKDIQRQQCYFPKSSVVLENPEGTANGFRVEAKSKTFIVLPGPPREIEAIWNSSLQSYIQSITTGLDAHVTLLWETMGLGESDVAVIVEEVLKNTDVDRGYRVHLPYVEVKLMFPESKRTSLEKVIADLDQALAFCTFAKTDEDSAFQLARLISGRPLAVHDTVTGSYLVNRMLPAFRSGLAEGCWSFSNQPAFSETRQNLQLGLKPLDEHSCEVLIAYKNQVYRDIIVAPYKTLNMRERRLQYFAECALLFWIRKLQN